MKNRTSSTKLKRELWRVTLLDYPQASLYFRETGSSPKRVCLYAAFVTTNPSQLRGYSQAQPIVVSSH